MPTQFIITCAARTGSTMLRHLLNSHPEILCHGEVYKRRGWSRHFQREKFTINKSNTDPVLVKKFKEYRTDNFIQEHLLSTADKTQKAVGFKFKTDEYFDRIFTPVAKSLRENKAIKIIHLKRKDLLAQYVSHVYVLKQYSQTVIFKHQETQKGQIKIEKNELMNFCDDVIMREKLILEEMSHHDIINVWYEEIVNQASILSGIQEFLEVSPRTLQTETKKIIKSYTDLILNIDEVYQWLKESRFEERTMSNKY